MLKGKGMYVWILGEKDDPGEIAAACFAAGLSHVAIKIADGIYPYNMDAQKTVDYVQPLVDELRAYGISPWGWQFVYGDYASAEAAVALQRIEMLDVDGFIINAESQYKNKPSSAQIYMDILKNRLQGKIPLALSSFRFPEYHSEFPWTEFLSQVDINMPQVYWILSHNAGAQLERCVAEFALPKYPQVPIFPTGAAFTEQSWLASPGEVQEFMQTAKDLGLAGCNFWLYSHAHDRFPELWDVISKFDWPGEVEPDPGDVVNPGEPVPMPEGVLFYAKCTASVRARIRKTPDGAIVGYLEAGTVEPILGVEVGWYRIAAGYVGSTLMEKVAPPVSEELTLSERMDRVERILDALLKIHPEVKDAA